jgi:hypothetical protein
MRSLGVVSVADMVKQLPNNIASVSPEDHGARAEVMRAGTNRRTG